MRVPHLQVPTLLVSLCVVTSPAQSSAQGMSDSSQPASLLTQDPGADLVFIPFLFTPQNSLDSAIRDVQSQPKSGNVPGRFQMQRFLTPEEDDAACLKLRVYRVARENPNSDTTRPVSYTTCPPAARFQLRTTVDSQTIAPR